MRSGAGLVTLAVPEGLAQAFVKKKIPEVMLLPLAQNPQGELSLRAFGRIRNFLKDIDVVAIGPGLTQQPAVQSFARALIAQASGQHLVIDADALAALKGHMRLLRKRSLTGRSTVLTPHPGEMSRLLGVSIADVQKERLGLAKKTASAYNLTVVLKGSRTVVAGPGPQTAYTNTTGNPGMSTAGSGDVLTGIIAAFLAQGLKGFSAAMYAVYVHGLAGDLAAQEKTQPGMIASDIIAHLPEALKKCS